MKETLEQRLQSAAWKQHVKDMEQYAFKDPQKYHEAFITNISHTISETLKEAVRVIEKEKARWNGNGEYYANVTEALSTAITTLEGLGKTDV